MSSHPSENISSENADTLRKHALLAEQNKSLTPEQLQVIRSERWFDLFVPENNGGLGKNFPAALRLLEAIAWADGSTGWTVTLCSGAGWFIGFLDAVSANEIFSDPLHCIAGSGKQTGVAKAVPGGFEISGSWSHATGAPIATVFTFNCLAADRLMSFWVPEKQVTIRETWDAMGMIATASHSFELNKVFVPAEHSFIIDSSYAIIEDIIFRFPFQYFAEATLAVNISGMALRFLELAESIDRPKLVLPPAFSRLLAARSKFFRCVDDSWDELAQNRKLSEPQTEALHVASKQLVSCSRSVVNDVFPHCGLVAAQWTSELNRVWRNLQTASLHALLT